MVRRVNYKDRPWSPISLSKWHLGDPEAATVATCASAVGRTERRAIVGPVSARFGLTDSGREAGAHKGQALDSRSPSHSAYATIPSYPQEAAASCTLLCTLSPGVASSNSSRLCFQVEWWYKCRLCQLSDLASLLPQTSLGQ